MTYFNEGLLWMTDLQLHWKSKYQQLMDFHWWKETASHTQKRELCVYLYVAVISPLLGNMLTLGKYWFKLTHALHHNIATPCGKGILQVTFLTNVDWEIWGNFPCIFSGVFKTIYSSVCCSYLDISKARQWRATGKRKWGGGCFLKLRWKRNQLIALLGSQSSRKIGNLTIK